MAKHGKQLEWLNQVTKIELFSLFDSEKILAYVLIHFMGKLWRYLNKFLLL